MPTYEVVEENVKKIGEFQRKNIWQPKYRCKKCSRAIRESYTRTTQKCRSCNKDELPIGEYLSRVYAMTVYISDVEPDGFIQALFDLKNDFEHVSEFSELLEKGFDDYPVSDSELIVVPPSGTADSDAENHMIPIGEEVGSKVGVPFRNITYKKKDYPSQKHLGFEERIENVRGKIGCTEESIAANKAVVLDDIATSCATLSATAQALIESGVSEVRALVIARDEDIQSLEFANVLSEKEA